MIFAFALPVLLIIGIAVSVYWPFQRVTTDYDFIYATCDRYNYSHPTTYSCFDFLNSYKVENNKLTILELPLPPTNRPAIVDRPYIMPIARLFLHDSESNEGREITLAEVQTLKLSGLITSPDGVSVSNKYDRGADFFPFFDGGSSYGYYLIKGGKKQRLNLLGDNNNYYGNDNFRFIGWIIK